MTTKNIKTALSTLPILPSLLAAALFALPSLSSTAGASPLHHGPATCKSGFVWREAVPGDLVCVTPAVRAQAAYDNRQAVARRDVYGAYGSASCKSGYVWREAFANDLVCVTPATRDQAKRDNARAAARVAR